MSHDGKGSVSRQYDSFGRRALTAPLQANQNQRSQANEIDYEINVVKALFNTLKNLSQQQNVQAQSENSRVGSSRPTLQPHNVVDKIEYPKIYTAVNDGVKEFSWKDLYSINWKPKRLLVKFRQHTGNLRLGFNSEFSRVRINPQMNGEETPSVHTLLGFNVEKPRFKIVLKPTSVDQKWKILFEPQRQDLRLLTKKVRLGRYAFLQVGIGHEFITNTTGLKWKVTTALASSESKKRSLQIQEKTTIPIFPGFDLRAGWRAEYVFPEINGSLGTGEPVIGLNPGKINGIIDRIETIFNYTW